ncbi:uncharacterized protein LOC106132906 [Amyelois transitella]|uniref:uncharacterized protein LOC106132906 n=1 Tax=Amyelois transitella TaxID=680683 RepID=UPI00298F8DAF|nr:uncharacterized protein LOC106132906 [Amyelois transitella]
MCGVCCVQLKGWCKAFTKTEIFLCILEALLLILFIASLTILVLHFLACNKKEIDESTYPGNDKGYQPEDSGMPAVHSTVAPDVKCTWKPKQQTKAPTHYYEQSSVATTTSVTNAGGVSRNVHLAGKPTSSPPANRSFIDEVLSYLSDGEEAESYKRYVLSLVKIRPPQDVTFGCILTIVADYWVVTAASCIEAIEEVDSLDSFVMMEGYGEGEAGGTHAVADVLMHPWYQGSNHSYDVVALKSERRLVGPSRSAVEFASLIDYYLLPIGEKLTILGYGRYRYTPFRYTDQGPSGRGLLHVSSFLLPARQCAAGERWAPRHLSRPHAAPPAACRPRPLCAGALAARGAACNYCAGTPLLLRARLLGLMSDNPQCGVACEPVLFVNVALVRPWLDALVENDDDLVV